MRLKESISTPSPESSYDNGLDQELRVFIRDLSAIINGGLLPDDNFSIYRGSVADTGTADTEFTVTHSLKRTPIGFHVINIDQAGIVYNSGTAWTATQIYLKCNINNASISVIVF